MKSMFQGAVKTSSVLQKALDEAGQRKNLGPLPEDAFIVIDEQPILYSGFNEVRKYPSLETDLSIFEKRLAEIGTYNTNNGIVSAVNHEGKVIVAPVTNARMIALKEAGYKQNSALGVPLSNGEYPVRPHIAKTFSTMQKEANLEWEKMAAGQFEEECLAHAKAVNNGEEPDPIPATFMEVDGLVYNLNSTDPELNLRTIAVAEAYRGTGRTQEAGTYASNNGLIAVVDTKGHLHLGAATSENFEALSKAGYKGKDFYVPLSNGEIPMGWVGQLDPSQTRLHCGVDQTLIQDLNQILGREYNATYISEQYSKKQAGKAQPTPAPV